MFFEWLVTERPTTSNSRGSSLLTYNSGPINLNTSIKYYMCVLLIIHKTSEDDLVSSITSVNFAVISNLSK